MEEQDTIEQLLKVVGLTGEIPTESKAKDPGVLNFILDLKISDGPDKIPQAIIYEKYKNKTQDPLQMKAFFREFRKYFKQHRTNTARFYMLKKEAFNLPVDFSIYKQSFGFQRTKKKAVIDGQQEEQQVEKEEA